MSVSDKTIDVRKIITLVDVETRMETNSKNDSYRRSIRYEEKEMGKRTEDSWGEKKRGEKHSNW